MSEANVANDLRERMATLEAQYQIAMPLMGDRIERLEEKSETILVNVTETKTKITAIKMMLQKNGFGKEHSHDNTDVKILKLETKISRWINRMLIVAITLILSMVGVVVAIVSMRK